MLLRTLGVMGGLLTAMACSSTTNPESATVFGIVNTAVVQDTTALVLVERRNEGPVYLRIGPSAKVTIRETDGTSHSGSYADIRVGDSIEADRAGPELRSSPPQYTATRVVAQRR